MLPSMLLTGAGGSGSRKRPSRRDKAPMVEEEEPAPPRKKAPAVKVKRQDYAHMPLNKYVDYRKVDPYVQERSPSMPRKGFGCLVPHPSSESRV